MPGFVVQGMGGAIGAGVGVNSRRQYYYNYFWEIDNLFGTSFLSNEALIGLKDASLPTFTVNKETYVGSSLEYKFAKSIIWEDIKVAWYDSDGLLSSMRDWRKMVWKPESGLQMANDYKKRSRIQHFLPTGKKVNTWTLYNSWPSQIRNGELTYTSSEVKLVEVTVTYDWAEETVGQ